jgi:HK97 family phage major capsid protein
MDINALQERLQELLTDNEALTAKAEAEKRDFTVEEGEQFDRNLEAFEHTKANIERLQSLGEQQQVLTAGSGRKTQPDQLTQQSDDDAPPQRLAPKGGSVRVLPNPTLAKNGGFHSLGEMAFHVRRSALNGGSVDPRLERLAAATTYGNETSGTDGGFAVPPDFRNTIMETVMGGDTLVGRCDQIRTSSNNFSCPADETTPWQTSGGIQAYWDGEASTMTQTKPSLQDRTVKLNRITALVAMTDELLEDAPALDSYLRRKAPQKIAHKVDDAILHGTGNGMPLGIAASPSIVSVTKESSQIADSLIANNIIKMYNRMYAPSRSTAVWLINPELEPWMMKLSLAGLDNDGNTVSGWGSQLYFPPGGLSGSPYGVLLGRPVIPHQACKTAGDVGDIFFADFSQYMLLLKAGANPRVDTSMHLWFDQNATAFRFVLRVGGMPWWSTTMAAANGSATYSPFVTLGAR